MTDLMTDLDIIKVKMTNVDEMKQAMKPAKMQKDMVSVFRTYQSGPVPESMVPHSAQRNYYRVNVIPSTATAAPSVNQISLGLTGVAAYNNNAAGVLQTITGGTVTAIAINGTTTGLTSGVFYVPAGGTVTVTYSVPPTTFTTAGVPVTVTSSPVYLCSSSGDAQQTGGLGPQGMLLPPGFNEQLFGTTEVWLVCPGANPPLVSVESTYDRG